VKALLEGSPLFGYARFSVPQAASRVIYLVPESSIAAFWSRVRLFRLQEYVRADALLIRTLSFRDQLLLDDPRLLKAVENAYVVLDTVCRFMTGSENDVADTRPFAHVLFRLLSAGARTIVGAHHSPKSLEGQDALSLQSVLRGSGDLGALVSSAYGVRQIDAVQNRLYFENVKSRDFQACDSFIIEGRPHLDESGQFKMIAEPGNAGELREHLHLRGGRPPIPDKDSKVAHAVELRSKGLGIRDIARTIGTRKSTIDRWLFDYDASQNRPIVGQVSGHAEPDREITH
jgi:hypothetical protein